MTFEKALELYHDKLDCSQIVFAHGAEDLGMDAETAYRIGAGFGGGMFEGKTCGCVTGAIMALGLAYGHCEPGDEETKNKMIAIKAEFEKMFKEEHGSIICSELLGYKIPEDMETIVQKGLMDKTCPQLAVTACEILDELL